MNRPVKIISAVMTTLVIAVQCGKIPSNPGKKTVQFNFTFQKSGDTVTPPSSSAPRKTLPAPALKKELALEAFDMVRIMVIDLSAYESWSNFSLSETGQAYTVNRNSWTGDPGNWWEWKDVWQDYATIVSDQTLEIRGLEAVGTVTGVIGYNEFLAGLFIGGRVRYWATGNGWGEEGETHDVTLTNFTYIAPTDPTASVP